jgi:hypothetical protein
VPIARREWALLERAVRGYVTCSEGDDDDDDVSPAEGVASDSVTQEHFAYLEDRQAHLAVFGGAREMHRAEAELETTRQKRWVTQQMQEI